MGLLNFQSPLFEQNFTTYLSSQLTFKQKETVFQEVIFRYSPEISYWTFDDKKLQKKVDKKEI